MQDSTVDFCKSYQKRLAQLKESANTIADNLRRLFIYLQSIEPRLGRIEVSYEGSGDSGQTESAVFYDQGNGTEWSRKPIEFDDSLIIPDEVFDANVCKPSHWVKEQGHVPTLEASNLSVESILDNLAWDLAYSNNPGFEINEGGYGTVIISYNPPGDEGSCGVTVALQHSERIINTNDTEYVF